MTLSDTTSPSQFPDICGYEIIQLLYAGTRTVVYRAIEVSSQRPVVVKLLQQAYPSFHDLLQFRNQYSIVKNLSLSGIVRFYGIESYGNSYALIMEDFGGVSLAQYVQAHSLSLVQILAIAHQLAEILHSLHQSRIIHKDIKPANILIHPESQQIKLIDFSIASLLPREAQEIQNPNILEGTLAYLAPEQTGRMNRGIDYRADFYAFGVTLYELLTGALPFAAIEPLELVHCHIAKSPLSADCVNSNVPKMIAAIVSKLMAKNAEDRYQSALGCKYDLEQCLIQWKETGAIAPFELGQRDVSDRFLIPEKLYGRQAEVKALLAAFNRVSSGSSELMLVAGFSGMGKTAVVNEVHKPITRQNGYFIKGKFDQFNRNIPLSAFVQALRDLMGQLLCESDAHLQRWKTEILQVLGENGQVLIDVIPELEQIVGHQPAAPELAGSAAQHRFNLLFQKFFGVFTTVEHPLVLFLDDLQWADLASLQLMKLLVNDNGYLLVLGAYRDNEVSPAHPFMMAVEELKKAAATVNTVVLKPLAFADSNELIADTLNCSLEIAKPLAEVVDRKAQGNPFFVTQFLKVLHEERYIIFNLEHRCWECDFAQVKTLALTDDVVEFMALQLQKLPDATQEILQIAACVGNQFDLKTLAIAAEQSVTEAAIALWQALQEGLVLPTTQSYKFFQAEEPIDGESINSTYRFLHDRVQQAAYSLISADRKQATHLKIGQRLLRHVPEADREAKLFEIVNQINYGKQLLSSSTDRSELAQLNLIASQRAKAATAYSSAIQYAKAGIELLSESCWQTQYDLALALYQMAAEISYLLGNFEKMESWAQSALHHARTTLDRVKIYELKIQVCVSQNRLTQGLEIACEILQQLGVDLPGQPTDEDFAQRLAETRRLIADREPLELLDLPLMSDLQHQAALRILSSLFTITYNGCPAMFPLVIFKQVCLSIQYGNTPFATLAYASYGLILAAFLEEVETGYEFGQLAIQLLAKLEAKEMKAKTLSVVNCFLTHQKAPLSDTFTPMIEGYQSGLAVGDLEWASWCAVPYTFYLYMSGENLAIAKQEMAIYSAAVRQFKQTTAHNCLMPHYQSVLNLLGESKNPVKIQGQVYDEVKMMPVHQASNDRAAIYHLYINKSILGYLFADYEQAVAALEMAKQHLDGVPSLYIATLLFFYDSLTLLAIATHPEEPSWQQIQANQDKLKRWAESAPMNHLHKWQLVEAERCRILNNKAAAIDLYDSAIAGAKANKYLQEEAIANELAAKFYLNWGKEKVAAGYLQEAYYCYARWGAKAKVQDLEQRYPILLTPILNQRPPSLSTIETLFSTEPHTAASITRSFLSSSSSLSAALDLSAILKASQSLSNEIELDELLSCLMNVVVETAGADKAALILSQNQSLEVVVRYFDGAVRSLQPLPIAQATCLPITVMQYVDRTQQLLISNEAIAARFSQDPYLAKQQPASFLCTPIINQGQIVGLLYLENSQAKNAFTSDRVELLKLLCTQAAISLKNARLYQQIQTYAQQIEKSQLQTVQSEKMASLGNLVAGIAHEINNPIGFLNGSISNTKEYVQSLLEHLELYQQHHPSPVAFVQDHAEDIDLDFIREDLPKLMNSMKGATDRIKGISTSLRTFSRADTEYKVSANLHEGLDSTLLILKYRLKGNEYRPAIQIVQDYSSLPSIECFPGQLNQVFMNILANAVDAFDESAQQLSSADLQRNFPKITIKTTVISEQNVVEIRICDNGKGMSEAIKARIFDHLFTTKGVGKGTGLGLAIAQQIVVEKHNGTLAVKSEVNRGTEFYIQLPIAG
ncbi:MAG: AAA family ATPase [Phormidesmis sp.]